MNGSLKIKLLIIDDNIDDCKIYKEFFSLHPEVEICAISTDGIEGINLAKKHRPDVVLTDFIMPNIDGSEIVRNINSTLGDKTKVIVLSGISDTTIINETLKCGADYYLMKPVELKFLLQKIISVYNKDKNHKNHNTYNNTKCYINNYVNSIGVPVGLSGYDYIIEGINIMVKNKRGMLLKEINGVIAKNNYTSIQCVDACMRNAIIKTHENCNTKYMNLFGKPNKCPSNYVFLRTIREDIINNKT